MTELTLKPSLTGLEKSKAEQIEKTFIPMIELLKNFETAYNNIIKESEKEISQDVVVKAKRLRLDISKVRIETEKVRKSEKEECLRMGKAIDGVANILKYAVVEKESKLKNIEQHFENIENERIAKLQNDRANELIKYEIEVIPTDLGTMANDMWINYIAGCKLNYETKKAAELKIEQDRIELENKTKTFEEREKIIAPYSDFWVGNKNLTIDTTTDEFNCLHEKLKSDKKKYDDEQEQIRLENAKLKAEAEEKERLAEIERKKQAEILKKQKEETDKKQAELEVKLKAEAEEKERLEKEKIEKEKLENEKQESFKTGKDEVKIKMLLEKLTFDFPEFESNKWKTKIERIKVAVKKCKEILNGMTV